jgi:tight adherence protein C
MDAQVGAGVMTMDASWLAALWFGLAFALALWRRPRPLRRRLPVRTEARAPRLPPVAAFQRALAALPLAARRRRRQLVSTSARELADVIDLLALAVGSGLNLRLALAAVAGRAPLSWVEPLTTTVARIDRGTAVADALDRLPGIVGDHAHGVVSVLVSSERYGTTLLPALERLATEARFDRRRRAEDAARRVPVKLLFPLVLCILPAFGALTVAPLLAGALESLRLS